MLGSREHGNEPSGSIKYWEILEKLRNWWFLKELLCLYIIIYIQ
jgi:hypothetical protein